MFKVSSEIYKETNFQTTKNNENDDKVVSFFKFQYPPESNKLDEDGDFVIEQRQSKGVLEIEHSEATEIRLVGLQVWRGALLLADFIFHNRHNFCDKQLLELGAGVGLTSIAAASYMRKVICTDVDIGGILNLIRKNIDRNRKLTKCQVDVLEFDFMKPSTDYAASLLNAIDESEIIVAADVIYDEALTNAFVRVIETIFEREKISKKSKTIYLALEKRYVFTFEELDAVAPMFDHFLKTVKNGNFYKWKFQYLELDFPQYFEYDRCAHLVLLKITSN